MDNYITTIRDLMIQATYNISDIKTKAQDSDPEACFQMGMIHLLGIKTPIDFKKASSFFGNQSLADDPDACRLLGFINECEGNYSDAFNKYAKAAGTTGEKTKWSYFQKVFEGRSYLQRFFKKLVLPNAAFNNEITEIINEYIKGDKSRIDACIKLATLCDDEITCIETAQSLYEAGDLYSAKRWLQKANVTKTNELFIAIENRLLDSKKPIKLPDMLQVIDLKGNSLLAESNYSSSIIETKYTCDNISALCKKTWMKDVSNLIEKIGNRIDKEEFIKKQIEEKKKEKRRKIDKNLWLYIFGPIALIIITMTIVSITDGKGTATIMPFIVTSALFVVLPFLALRWIIRKIMKLN